MCSTLGTGRTCAVSRVSLFGAGGSATTPGAKVAVRVRHSEIVDGSASGRGENDRACACSVVGRADARTQLVDVLSDVDQVSNQGGPQGSNFRSEHGRPPHH